MLTGILRPDGKSASSCSSGREPLKEEVWEEVVYDTLSAVPQHTVRNLPPFTNVSLRLVLSNPEGCKESEELRALTDEDGTSEVWLCVHTEPSVCQHVPYGFQRSIFHCSSWSRPTGVNRGQQLRTTDQS